ncbi:MAG TPA: GatB/YqeY domain-containing protein [Actinomycetota bacterium]|nr:GatB/YqeY domain-containing protein [Actinomycetota bacterium]
MLRDRIGEDLKDAMKARDQVRVATLRMLIAAVKNAQVEKMHELDDDEVIEVATREAKRRKESIEAFRSGGRDDLVTKEEAELAVLQQYLPEQLGDDELAALVDDAIAETGATGPKEMGAVMKALMPKVRGRADGAAVSAMVKQRLSG